MTTVGVKGLTACFMETLSMWNDVDRKWLIWVKTVNAECDFCRWNYVVIIGVITGPRLRPHWLTLITNGRSRVEQRIFPSSSIHRISSVTWLFLYVLDVCLKLSCFQSTNTYNTLEVSMFHCAAHRLPAHLCPSVSYVCLLCDYYRLTDSLHRGCGCVV